MDAFALVRPTVALRDDFLAMVEEYRSAEWSRYERIAPCLRDNFAGYVRALRNQARGIGLPKGYVPQTTYWSVLEGARVIGVVRLRHWLVPRLEREGGHIGYEIRPSERCKGYGTRQLALALEKARALGLERVLITCNTANLASARVIEKNGGVLENRVRSDYSGEEVSRYWIALGSR